MKHDFGIVCTDPLHKEPESRQKNQNWKIQNEVKSTPTHALFLFNLKISRICLNVTLPEMECRLVGFTAVEGYSEGELCRTLFADNSSHSESASAVRKAVRRTLVNTQARRVFQLRASWSSSSALDTDAVYLKISLFDRWTRDGLVNDDFRITI